MASTKEQQALRDAVAAVLHAWDNDTDALDGLMTALEAEHAAPGAYGSPDVAGLVEAAKAAVQFIENGVEHGYISMPDPDCPDPAHKTLPDLKRALANLPAAPSEPEPLSNLTSLALAIRRQVQQRLDESTQPGELWEGFRGALTEVLSLMDAAISAESQHASPEEDKADEWITYGPETLRKFCRALTQENEEIMREAGTKAEFFDVVFDAMPGPDGCKFIEVEAPDGSSIKVGEWVKRDDGYAALRIRRAKPAPSEPEPKTDGDTLHPECSGDPSSCPENEGHGCCNLLAEHERPAAARCKKPAPADAEREREIEAWRDSFFAHYDDDHGEVPRWMWDVAEDALALMRSRPAPDALVEATKDHAAALRRLSNENDKLREQFEEASETIAVLRPTFKEVERQRDALLEEARHWYRADGTFEVLESPEAVIEKRKEAAKVLEQAKAAGNARAMEELEKVQSICVDPDSSWRDLDIHIVRRIADLEAEPQPEQAKDDGGGEDTNPVAAAIHELRDQMRTSIMELGDTIGSYMREAKE